MNRRTRSVTACRSLPPTSPTRSPPARWSSGRRRSSRSWSRTRSTPARRAISVTIEFGGKKLIRVDDDGDGHDAPRTRGWRSSGTPPARSGARPTWRPSRRSAFAARRCRRSPRSRGSRLRTRARGALSGTEIRIDGRRDRDEREVGAPEGTLVEVGDLFYNLPARRKFLKADTAEAAQVSRLVTQLALGYPEVGFTLKSGGRMLLEAPPAGSS